MANLENFTDDERLIAFLLISKWAMLAEIERLTGDSVSNINRSLTSAIFEQFEDIDERQIAIAIKNARNACKTGIEQTLNSRGVQDN